MQEYYLSTRGERGHLRVAHRLHLTPVQVIDLVDRSNPINMTRPTWRTRVINAGVGILATILILAASIEIGG